MSAYKIIIRNSPGWRNFKSCALGISVTSPNWQDDRFASILEFAAQHFETIRIDVTDFLYRHNFMAEGLAAGEAEARAEALGDTWLKRHQGLIDSCPIVPDVIRWREWNRHPEFEAVLDGFRGSLASSPIFRDAIESDVDGFFRRLGQPPTQAERQHSRDYLVEEAAVMTLQARALPGLRIYPGDELTCLKVVRGGLVPEAPRGLEREQFAKVKFHARAIDAAYELCRPVELTGAIRRQPSPSPTIAALDS